MILILDAYNVIHKIRRLEALLDKDLRAGREALIKQCVELTAQRGDITRIILIFDGKTEYRDLPQSSPPKITVAFSESDPDADSLIGQWLEDLPERPLRCVVSDDNSVRNHARVYKARVMPVKEFEALFSKTGGKKPAGKPSAPQKSFLPAHKADEITREYKKALGLD